MPPDADGLNDPANPLPDTTVETNNKAPDSQAQPTTPPTVSEAFSTALQEDAHIVTAADVPTQAPTKPAIPTAPVAAAPTADEVPATIHDEHL